MIEDLDMKRFMVQVAAGSLGPPEYGDTQPTLFHEGPALELIAHSPFPKRLNATSSSVHTSFCLQCILSFHTRSTPMHPPTPKLHGPREASLAC